MKDDTAIDVIVRYRLRTTDVPWNLRVRRSLKFSKRSCEMPAVDVKVEQVNEHPTAGKAGKETQ